MFAIVPDLSDTNAGAYLNQQHVPYFGWAFDDTYCSPTPTTALYGFGFNGCLVPAKPKRMPGIGANQLYDIVTKKTGKKNPTLAIFSTDTQAGRDSTGFQASSYAGAGFKVVYSKGEIPPPPVADYTPYVQAVTTSDGGKAPDAMVCLAAIQCIDMWTKIKAGGYSGTFMSALYDPALVGAFGGALMLESGQPHRDAHAGDEADADRRRRDQARHADRVSGVRRLRVGRLLHPGAEEGGRQPHAGEGAGGSVEDDVPGEGSDRPDEVPRLARRSPRRRAARWSRVTARR